jgi:hypothetical protein
MGSNVLVRFVESAEISERTHTGLICYAGKYFAL